jgi:hypothetical protein
VLILPALLGADASATILVSGGQRTSMPLPAPGAGSSSSCGTSHYSVQSFGGQNFAYVEVRNPRDSAEAVALTVDGPNPEALSLFAYARPTPPSSKDDVNQCMVSDEARFEQLTPTPPALSPTNGKALVVGPHASAFVMLATRDRTGPFTMKARIVALASVADTPSLTIATTSGGEASASVLVSGVQRTSMPLPAPEAGSSSACGTTHYAVESFDGQNFAYVEVKNPGDTAAAVALSLDGASPEALSLFAYASSTPPSSKDDVNQCMVSDEGRFESLTPMPPSLSAQNGKALVIGPQASTFVLIGTRDRTGAVTMKTRTIGLAGVADRPSLTIPGRSGDESSATVLVSGAQRTAMPLPAPSAGSSSSCGATHYAVQSFNGQNFAYVELKNANDSAALVDVSVDGPNPARLSLFAYTSPTPPSSPDNVNACLVSDEGGFTSLTLVAPALSAKKGNPLVIQPHESAFVLLATNDDAGVFTLTAHVR